MVVISSAFAGILDDWLTSRGLSRSSAGERKSTSASMLSLANWTEEVRSVIALAPGPTRGLDIGAQVQLRHAGPLGYLVVESKTLGELLETYVLFEKWFYGQNWATSKTSGLQFEISWDPREGVPDIQVEQLHTHAFITLIRQACPTAGSPVRVEVMNRDIGEREAYEEAFACPVQFGKPTLRLVFPLAALEAPVDITNASINPAWLNRQRTLREAHPNATQFVRAVQEAIMHHLPAGAPADSVATILGVSRRTLQRRLADAGCSYRQLLDGIRERHVVGLLADPQLSLKEITFLLGYSEQSAFNHAYRRWTGTSPFHARCRTRNRS